MTAPDETDFPDSRQERSVYAAKALHLEMLRYLQAVLGVKRGASAYLAIYGRLQEPTASGEGQSG